MMNIEMIPVPVVLVCILNGGFMFFSDLVKQITVPIEIDFIPL